MPCPYIKGNNMINEFREIKSTTKELREFGLTIGVILAIFGALALWKGRPAAPYLLGAGALLIFLGTMIPRILIAPQKIWMGLAIIIGFVMSRVILAVLFFLVITPTALLLRMIGKDILDQRLEPDRQSYWNARDMEPKPAESYENQY